MNWIKCSDRLPSEYKDVLVFCTDHDSKDKVIMMAFYQPKSQSWDSDYTEGIFDLDEMEVTHWTPLPLPPSEICE